MQTFLPELSPSKIAAVLDYRRLGKQRVEVFQLLRANLDVSLGWRNHPAAIMWRGFEPALADYGVAICDEWIARGYKDTCRQKILDLVTPDKNYPKWWGREDIILSHRSNLIRKLPEFYLPLWPDTPDDIAYVWPT